MLPTTRNYSLLVNDRVDDADRAAFGLGFGMFMFHGRVGWKEKLNRLSHYSEELHGDCKYPVSLFRQ